MVILKAGSVREVIIFIYTRYTSSCSVADYVYLLLIYLSIEVFRVYILNKVFIASILKEKEIYL